MTIGNITSALFPPDWNPTDITSLGTQAVTATVAVVGLAAIALFVRNRNNSPPVAETSHKIEIKKDDTSLTITIAGNHTEIPREMIDEANGAIEAWRKIWMQKILDEEIIQAEFKAEEQNNNKKHIFNLIAVKIVGLTPTQQAVELRFLQNVSLFNIPKKQKTGHSSASTGTGKRRSLPIRRRGTASATT